jgi:hypothetical protein
MFKYMHGTSYFLMLWKIFELKKIFRYRREKICGISFKFRKYLNCETLEMFKYMDGTTFFKYYRNYLNLRKYLEIGERKYIEICGTSYLYLENI